ncbi:MAG: FecR domain-containing protein, partial [Candidatus Eremiobacteraeota bacterium]|nr:FecR domain-containing protein [Candidatus Eremiobacteraeota bacterium]
MRKKIVAIVVLIGFIFLAGFGHQAWAVSAAWKLVARVKGKVESQKIDERGWSPIWQARLLRDGDKARTLTNSRARIVLADKSYVILGQNTTVEMSEFKLTRQSRFVDIKLIVGKIRAEVSKFMGKDSSFEITTPNGVLSARGTEFFVQQKHVKEKEMGEESDCMAQLGGLGNTVLVVFSGTVWVQSPVQNVPIFGGQSAIITPGGFVRIYPSESLPPGSITESEGEEAEEGPEEPEEGPAEPEEGPAEPEEGPAEPGEGPPGDPDIDLSQAPSDFLQDVPGGAGGSNIPPGDTTGTDTTDTDTTGGEGEGGGEIIPQPPSYGIVPILINPGIGNLNIGILQGGTGQQPVKISPGTGNI